MTFRRTRAKYCIVSIAGAALMLSACAETRLAVHAAKQLSHPDESSGGSYKIGNPYKVAGVWYHPKVDYDYVETGIASWYGPQFHRKRTANGEIFDMNAITAAHKTLPLPSIVRVTNLKNGRSIKVVVNDRGPFARGRIIDVSRRTAQLLGFERAGTAPVKVEIIPDESRRIALIAQGRSPAQLAAAEPQPIRVAAKQPLSGDVTVVPTSGGASMYIQAGSFVQRDLAVRTQRSLAPIGPTRVVEAQVGDRRYYRVRVGPVATVSHGDRILDRVVASGFPDARLVVD
jgi:rare lipoprotein A